MSDNNRYSLMLEALAELAPEMEAMQPSAPQPALPSIGNVLAEFTPLPREALFLGVAMDGLPVFLNLQDSVPGPLLIAGDAGSGKTLFLQSIAHAVNQTHQAQDVQYGIITAHPEEWDSLERTDHCVDVFPAYKNAAEDFINSLASWAHSNRGESQSVLLLIDDLITITKMDFDARQSLRWLLLRGPARHVWPIVSLNPQLIDEIRPWDEFFRTRIFGKISDPQQVQNLSGSLQSHLESLTARSQFVIREDEKWLRFWIPSLE